MADEKKRYIGVSTSDDTYSALMRMATLQGGRHPTDLAESYIIRGIQEDTEAALAEGQDVPRALRVYLAYQQIRETQNTRFQLRQIAIQLVKQPSEELADQLDSLCQMCRVSYEEIMNEAQEATMVGSITVSIQENDNITNAVTWLVELGRATSELPSRDIYTKGAAQGFSKMILQTAKDRIGIVAVRKAKSWWWIFPDALKVPSSVRVRSDVHDRD